jgi:hypothetical protein
MNPCWSAKPRVKQFLKVEPKKTAPAPGPGRFFCADFLPGLGPVEAGFKSGTWAPIWHVLGIAQLLAVLPVVLTEQLQVTGHQILCGFHA